MNLPLLLLLMALATYRGTRLVVADTFPPLVWLRDRLAGGWRPLTEAEWKDYRTPSRNHGPAALSSLGAAVQDIDGVKHRYIRRSRWSPQWLADLVSCPWCASGWIAAAVTAAVWTTAGLPVPLLVWPAVWAAGALLAAQEWA